MRNPWLVFKRFFLACLVSLLLLPGCSNKPPVELVEASAQIKMDNNANTGQKTPTLHYKFILKNTTQEKIGDVKSQIKVEIKPDREFLSVLDQTVGQNIFDTSTRVERGYQGAAEIPPDNKGSEYNLSYVLETKNSTDNGSPSFPEQEKLNKIEQSALNATLIVTMGDKEIAQFDLRKY